MLPSLYSSDLTAGNHVGRYEDRSPVVSGAHWLYMELTVLDCQLIQVLKSITKSINMQVFVKNSILHQKNI